MKMHQIVLALGLIVALANSASAAAPNCETKDATGNCITGTVLIDPATGLPYAALGGGGGGGDASAANQTAVQALAGSDAAKAVAVQGITGGKPIEVGGHATVAGGTFTRPANTTAYAANSLYANSTTAGSVLPVSAAICRVNGGHGAILAASLSISNPLASGISFRLHIFKGTTSSPFVTTSVGDGGTWTGNVTLVGAIERGTIDINLTDKGSDGAKGWGSRNIGSTANAGGMIPYDCNTGVQNIYVLIETLGAYTPTSGETAALALEVVED